jgi:hypothetical protein
MQRTSRVSLAACVGALALAAAGLQGAKAADLGVGVPQYQAPPPVQEGYAYPPPPPAYVYPPPPPPVAYYYAPPGYEVVPDVYYGPGPYWRGGPRFAYGYGHWGRDWGYGHWGHGWHR